jgi:hypothetical protein
MIRTFFCLVFILSNSVVAQASFTAGSLGIARMELSSWTTTHVGEVQIDGMRVSAVMEAMDQEVRVPAIRTELPQLRVPLAPSEQKGFRLVLVASENPSLRARFALKGRIVNVDGVNRFGYLSEDPNQDFQFLILAREDGALQAVFTRKVGHDQMEQGEFTLAPLAQLLQE